MMAEEAGPRGHTAGWHLALATGRDRAATAIRIADRELILIPLGAGWHAVDRACARCGAALDVAGGRHGHVELTCAGCGSVPRPAASAESAVPVIVVDDEVYVYIA